MNITRYLHQQVKEDLQEKMVFLGGPRQVGKTTLAKQFISSEDQYLNWDRDADRKLILRDEINPRIKLLVMDEIHKYAKWRNLLKGYYDKFHPKLNFLVTGSARLDYFRKGGDSLVGRYHYLRLHPISLTEMNKDPSPADVELLIKFGGFPEPLFKQRSVHHARWQMERISRVIHEDLRDLEKVKELSLIDLLIHSLVSKVGGPLSIKSLQEDLQVSPNTVDRWIEILERLYYCYRISPYGPPKIKAVKKTQKLYLWDWSELEDKGACFENLVASHLIKFCHYEEDTRGIKTELRYFKDVVTEKEIDFIVLQKNKPIFAVECKTGEREISKSFVNNCRRLNINRIYQVHLGRKSYGTPESGRVLPFYEFCKEQNLP